MSPAACKASCRSLRRHLVAHGLPWAGPICPRCDALELVELDDDERADVHARARAAGTASPQGLDVLELARIRCTQCGGEMSIRHVGTSLHLAGKLTAFEWLHSDPPCRAWRDPLVKAQCVPLAVRMGPPRGRR